MWELPSGSFAEEVLYNRFKSASSELLAHSFVIDIHDRTVETSFEPGDWQAILKKVLEWPENDQSLTESMKRFWKVVGSFMFLYADASTDLRQTGENGF